MIVAVILSFAVLASATCQYTSGFAYNFHYGQYISLPDNTWVNHQANTFSAWIKPFTLTTDYTGIVGSAFDTSDREHNEGLIMTGDGSTVFFVAGTNFDLCPRASVALFKWSHVVGTYDENDNNGTVKIFVNGVLGGVSARHGKTRPSVRSFFVGRFLDDNEDKRFSGQIDEVSVWNYSMSDSEVASLYKKRLSGNETGLLLYYAAEGDNSTAAIDHSPNHRDGEFGGGWFATLGQFQFAANCRGCFNQTFPRCSPWDSDFDVCGDHLLTGDEECEDTDTTQCTDCRCDNGTEPRIGHCVETGTWNCVVDGLVDCVGFTGCQACPCAETTGVDCFLAKKCNIEDVGMYGTEPWSICLELCPGTHSRCYDIVPSKTANFTTMSECEAHSFCWCFGSCIQSCSDCLEMCGNSRLDPGEACDDGNAVSGDGCDSVCAVEGGWLCTTAGHNCSSVCGDGMLRGTEICDDGNTVDGDGCSGNCSMIEEGFTCNTTVAPTVCAAIPLPPPKGVSPGVIASIVVGCAVFGLVAVAFFVLLARITYIRRHTKYGFTKVSLSTIFHTPRTKADEFDPTTSTFVPIEEFPIQISPEAPNFGVEPPALAPLEEALEQTITLTSSSVFFFRIVPFKTLKYDFTAAPPSGVVKDEHPVTVSLKLAYHCTTAIGLKLPIIASPTDLSKKSSKDTAQHTFLEIKLESRPSTRLDPDEIALTEPPIGSGGYSVVYRATYRKRAVATKVLKFQDIQPQKTDFEREVHVMESLRSPFIVDFIGAVMFSGHLSLVTEFMALGSLGALVHKGNASYGLKVRACRDAAKGMAFLHDSRLMHRDMKPDNILMNSLDEQASVVAKLTDFGTTREVAREGGETYTRGVGTPMYMAPELLDSTHGEYSASSDIYSFAVSMFETISPIIPYSTDDFKKPWDIARFVTAGKRLPIPETTPEEFAKLIVDCWAQDPMARPNFQTILQRLEEIIIKLHPDGLIAKMAKGAATSGAAEPRPS